MRRLRTGQSPNEWGNDQRVPNVLRGLQKRQEDTKEFKYNREIDTGQTWVDGKIVYRWVLDLGSLPNTTTKTLAHGVKYSEIVKLWGVANNGLGGFLPLPYVDVSTTALIEFRVSGDDVLVQTSTNFSGYTAYAVLEYTK